MTIFVCKMCGRAIKVSNDEKPNYCYSDRMDQIENIGEEDSKRMDLFSMDGTHAMPIGPEGSIDWVLFEFPADIRWHPFTGEPLELIDILNAGYRVREFWNSLSNYQDIIMKEVHNDK